MHKMALLCESIDCIAKEQDISATELLDEFVKPAISFMEMMKEKANKR